MALFFFRMWFYLLCGFLFTVASASQPAGNETTPFSRTFSFSPYSSQRNDIINHFLLKIAEGNGKLRAYTSYTLSGEYMAGLEAGEHGLCAAAIRFSKLQFSGDLLYRAFSLEKMLMPDLASFRLIIRNNAGETMFERTFSDIEMPLNGGMNLQLPAHICGRESYHVRLSDLEFYYSENIFERFSSWLQALESYYESGELLEEINRISGDISFSDPETLILDEFPLCEAEQMLASIQYASFHEWLELEHGDPDKVLPRFRVLAAKMDSLRRGFNRAISEIDDMFYEKAGSRGNDKYYAQQLYHQALVYNPFHIPSNLAIATFDLERHNKSDALSRLTRIIAKMHPTGAIKDSTHALTDRIHSAYFADIKEIIDDGRFLDALKLLDEVEQFCKETFALYDCPEQLFRQQLTAHKGMFRSFMIVSERAFLNDNLPYCLTYLRSALEYQEQHSLFVPDRSDAVKLLQRVAGRYREQGERLYTQGDILDASEKFLKARELCEEFPFLDCQ